MLKETEILKNWEDYCGIIDKALSSRADLIHKMNDSLGIERMAAAPACGQIDFHNCFDGGYIDHVLRVIKFSLKFYQHYTDLGLDTSNVTKEEVVFSAMHHDLGKIGYPGEGNDHYIKNTSEWHVKNQGKVYTKNPLIPNMPIQDRSLYLLQQAGIICTNNEWIAIKTHDSLYDEANNSYMKTWSATDKYRSNLPLILQTADYAAYQFEFERWMKSKTAPIKYEQYKTNF